MASRPGLEWMWKSNSDPWKSSDEEEWRPYSDVERAMIEQAYQANQGEVLLDEYHIDLKKSVQISNWNASNQRPVKRVERGRTTDGGRLREARFLPTPIRPDTPFADQKFFLGFVGQLFQIFGVNESEALRQPAQRRRLIEKAADGIVSEGKLLAKQREGEWLAEQLLQVIDRPDQEVWQCAAHLYTMESFLYRKMNEYMRLCGDESHKGLWKSKIQTFGPFAYILQMFSHAKNYQKVHLYRGANLSDDLIEKFGENIGTYLMFPAFTSTSRNREKAEQFGNALFIIHTGSTSGNDVAPFSDYPDEEETLLNADFNFYIRSCTFDQAKNKWLINISSWLDD